MGEAWLRSVAAMPCAVRAMGQQFSPLCAVMRTQALSAAAAAPMCAGTEENAMAKAYWINTFRSISDPERLHAYIKLAGPAMRQAGGRFLARGNPAAAFESGARERTTLIEFDSVESAVAAYNSAAYQEALAVLGDAAVRDLRIIEALE
jgi:uncharacterized protein (DUF1330 family)